MRDSKHPLTVLSGFVLKYACVLVLSLLTALPASPPVIDARLSGLITTQRGTMPILLTVPHGGSASIPGVPERTSGDGKVAQDIRTRELTLAVSAHLESTVCAKPYIVLAEFHRRYIDANRAPSEAYEHPDAAAVYEEYHTSIREFVDEIRTGDPAGSLIIDVHGQSGDPGRIHRGTRNGQTITRLLAQNGDAALIGPDSIFGQLSGRGYELYPPNTPTSGPSEDPRWIGGYTVTRYGSHNNDGIDALQIELGSKYRERGAVNQLAANIAESIASFYRAFISGDTGCTTAVGRASADGLNEYRAG